MNGSFARNCPQRPQGQAVRKPSAGSIRMGSRSSHWFTKPAKTGQLAALSGDVYVIEARRGPYDARASDGSTFELMKMRDEGRPFAMRRVAPAAVCAVLMAPLVPLAQQDFSRLNLEPVDVIYLTEISGAETA